MSRQVSGRDQKVRIVSGGQTGADRAALDFAIRHSVPYAGWVPKGRKAEDGPLPAVYNVRETRSARYSERTRKNVQDSDGTLIVYRKQLSGGTALTHRVAVQIKKPVVLIDLKNTELRDAAQTVRSWINENKISVVNVAGPRESQAPGMYEATMRLLEEVFARSA